LAQSAPQAIRPDKVVPL